MVDSDISDCTSWSGGPSVGSRRRRIKLRNRTIRSGVVIDLLVIVWGNRLDKKIWNTIRVTIRDSMDQIGIRSTSSRKILIRYRIDNIFIGRYGGR